MFQTWIVCTACLTIAFSLQTHTPILVSPATLSTTSAATTTAAAAATVVPAPLAAGDNIPCTPDDPHHCPPPEGDPNDPQGQGQGQTEAAPEAMDTTEAPTTTVPVVMAAASATTTTPIVLDTAKGTHVRAL